MLLLIDSLIVTFSVFLGYCILEPFFEGYSTKLLILSSIIYNKDIEFEFGDERLGDVKHSLADINDLQGLGYKSEYDVVKGLSEYLAIENKKVQEV